MYRRWQTHRAPPKTKELVDSIIKRRMHKLELGMSELEGPVTVKLNNLSVMELNTIRPFFQIALQRFQEYAQVCPITLCAAYLS